MYFEIFKREIETLMPLIKDRNATYTVLEGPNHSGKSSICNNSEWIATSTLTDTGIFMTIEPPYLRINCVPDNRTVREFLKSGSIGPDPREQAGLFCIARREMQYEVNSGNIHSDVFTEMNKYGKVKPIKSLVISDRGIPSTNIFQIKAQKELGGVKKAIEIENVIKTAYDKKYLVPYDLVIFVDPSDNTKPYDPDDYFAGKWDEKRLYREETLGSFPSNYYTNNVVWLVNDVSGNTNDIGEPVLSAASTVIATSIYSKLEMGKVLEIPLVIPTDSTIPQRFGFDEIRSGNVILNSKNNNEARIEFTDELPKVR